MNDDHYEALLLALIDAQIDGDEAEVDAIAELLGDEAGLAAVLAEVPDDR